ncbi:hypothetical protein DESC_630002 [Desulfosarcina cetonica]|nr:hypothetical protein DESC_630002 [Desulfosarcina cetonica]
MISARISDNLIKLSLRSKCKIYVFYYFQPDSIDRTIKNGFKPDIFDTAPR